MEFSQLERVNMIQLVTKDEISTLDYNEINDRIYSAFKYDDFAWQKDRGIQISHYLSLSTVFFAIDSSRRMRSLHS